MYQDHAITMLGIARLTAFLPDQLFVFQRNKSEQNIRTNLNKKLRLKDGNLDRFTRLFCFGSTLSILRMKYWSSPFFRTLTKIVKNPYYSSKNIQTAS